MVNQPFTTNCQVTHPKKDWKMCEVLLRRKCCMNHFHNTPFTMVQNTSQLMSPLICNFQPQLEHKLVNKQKNTFISSSFFCLHTSSHSTLTWPVLTTTQGNSFFSRRQGHACFTFLRHISGSGHSPG